MQTQELILNKVTVMHNFYVYGLFRNDTSSIFYVGKGSGDRLKNHRGETKSIIKKGVQRSIKTNVIISLWKSNSDFYEKILYDNLTEEQAWKKEKELIKFYGRIDIGTGVLTNMSDGGDGPANRIPWNKNVARTNDVKIQLRNANLGKKYSVEVNLKKGRKGRVSNRKGKILTEEVKNKIRNSLLGVKCPSRGRTLSEERKVYLSQLNKGRKMPNSFIEKQRLLKKGNKYNLGKHHSEETKKKISQAQKGKIISLETRIKMSDAKKRLKKVKIAV